MEIIELLTPHYEVAWLPWAVQYFFLVGIAACTALIAAGCAFTASGSAGDRLLPAAVSVLAVSAIAAPVSLLADLHQPGRFWHFYAHLTPWSWMSLGAVLRSEEHTSELQSLMRTSYAVFCLQKNKHKMPAKPLIGTYNKCTRRTQKL